MRILYSFKGSVRDLLRALTPCTGNMYSCPCEGCATERAEERGNAAYVAMLQEEFDEAMLQEERSNYGIATM